MAFAPGTEQTFDFRGRAGEWFGIWIVNLLLSIVTFGIYSAWAKVRRLKYFYNNSYMDGRNFDYHATGWQILKGRLIFIAGYVVFSLIVSLAPIVGLILLIGLVALIPWLLVRAMMFNARMTSFSNVRFNFVGTYGRSFLVFILLPFVLYLAFGLLGGLAFFITVELFPEGGLLVGMVALVFAPVALAIYDRVIKGFSINNHMLGNAGFTLDISLRPFLMAQIAALAWVIFVGGIGIIVTGFSVDAFVRAIEGLERGETSGFGVIALFYFLIFFAIIPAAFIYQALIRNAVYNHTSLKGGHRFRSDISWSTYCWIAVSNFVIAVCTLGLMLPWAQIRMMKYLSDHTHVTPGSSMDDFIGDQVAAGNAIGDAYGDFEAVDIGLPV
ncbi:MAG: YjgN family protein [Pseudomonadota bacterium]